MSVNTDFCKINNFSKTLSIQEFPNYVANVIFETFFNAPHFLSAIEDDFSVSRNNKTLEFIDAFVITEKYHGFHDLYIKTYNDKHDEDFLEYKKYRNTQHGDIAIMNEHFAKDPEYQKFKKRVFMAFCNDKIGITNDFPFYEKKEKTIALLIEWLQSNRDRFQEQDEVDVDFFTNEHAFHDLPLDDFIPKAAEFIFTNISNQNFYYIDRINAFNQRIVIGKQTFFFFTTLRDGIYNLNDLNCYNPIHNEIINDFFDSISEEESQNVENFDGKETFREWEAYKIWKCRSFQGFCHEFKKPFDINHIDWELQKEEIIASLKERLQVNLANDSMFL